MSVQESDVTTTFEWRPEYVNRIYMEEGKVKVEDTAAPFLSSGIYNHYSTIVTEEGKTVQFVPNFLFGIPQTVLEKFYKGAEGRSSISGHFKSFTLHFLRPASPWSVPQVSDRRQTNRANIHGVCWVCCGLGPQISGEINIQADQLSFYSTISSAITVTFIMHAI